MTKKIRDIHKAGRSRLVPWKPGEPPIQRHRRRLQTNCEHFGEMLAWCHQRGLTLIMRNKGQHWQIYKDGIMVEWWPSSAKLVFNKHWYNGIHCHDYKQVQREIERRMRDDR